MQSLGRRRATLSLSLSLRAARPFRASDSDGAEKNEERNPAERVELGEQLGSGAAAGRLLCVFCLREREKTVL